MNRPASGSRFAGSFRHALRGIWHVLRTEQNFRIHVVTAVLAVLLGWYFRLSGIEFALLLLAIGFVLSAEVLNTVIEDFLDILHPAHHPAVGKIKDALAGAVLMAALVALVLGILVFLPHVLAAMHAGTVK